MDKVTKESVAAINDALNKCVAAQQAMFAAFQHLKLPKLEAAQLQEAAKALAEFVPLQTPQVSAGSQSWARRSQALRPYLARYVDEPPVQMDYPELSALVGLSVSTIRIKISNSPLRGFVRLVGGRNMVVLRDPGNLQRLLDEKLAATQNPDDRYYLARRVPTSK